MSVYMNTLVKKDRKWMWWTYFISKNIYNLCDKTTHTPKGTYAHRHTKYSGHSFLKMAERKDWLCNICQVTSWSRTIRLKTSNKSSAAVCRWAVLSLSIGECPLQQMDEMSTRQGRRRASSYDGLLPWSPGKEGQFVGKSHFISLLIWLHFSPALSSRALKSDCVFGWLRRGSCKLLWDITLS